MSDHLLNNNESGGGDYPNHFYNDVIASLTALKSQKQINESAIEDTKEHFKEIEKSIAEIREMARDAKHISIGVDGRNGLRGTLEHLARDVSRLAHDVEFVKKAADDYIGLKSFFTKLLVGSFMGIVTQVCFAVWYVSAQHTQQEALKADVARLLARADTQSAAVNSKALLK
jgi:hypothetical protein